MLVQNRTCGCPCVECHVVGPPGVPLREQLLSGSVLLCFFLVLAIRAASVQFCSAKTVVALRR